MLLPCIYRGWINNNGSPVYRVHWLKAQARNDRWREEVVLLLSEMEWTEGYFRHMARLWESRGHTAEQDVAERSTQMGGLICYAKKEQAMWTRMADRANAAFSTARRDSESMY